MFTSVAITAEALPQTRGIFLPAVEGDLINVRRDTNGRLRQSQHSTGSSSKRFRCRYQMPITKTEPRDKMLLKFKLYSAATRRSYLRHGALSLEPSGVPLLGLAGCCCCWWCWWGWGEWEPGSEKQGLFSFSAGEMTSSASHCSRTSKDCGRRARRREKI